MLITHLKPNEEIMSLAEGKIFIISCIGCREVHFPETEAAEALEQLSVNRTVLGFISTDYVCNPENLDIQLKKHIDKANAADTLLVFSCGVGVQTVAVRFADKKVFAACDTCPLPGWQGLTPLEYDCDQCGECYLSSTGGICPITACAKSLVNGQCGGSMNSMCEVDKDMECGWERIYKRLGQLGLQSAMLSSVKIRDFRGDIV